MQFFQWNTIMNPVTVLVVSFCIVADARRDWSNVASHSLEHFENPGWRGGHTSEGGQHGRPPYYEIPPPPPFLQNVSKDAAREFLDIVMSDNLTKAEIQSKMEEWATKHGVLEAYKEDIQNMKDMEAKIKTEAEELLKNVIEVAKKIEEMKENMNITKKEEMKQIFELMKEAPETVVMVLKAIGKALTQGKFPHDGHGGPRPGGFPGGNAQ